ncbi:MAG: urate hydroxylase PuuD [Alphaproteobacteria bacterium]|nr:urate hydroxylase PuuD [Alphaproteobacteria bacterium]
MFELAIIWEWLGFAVRWLHVITGIAWIGSSFYFIALDLGLRQTPSLPVGAHGEEWQVHGGGFYHIQKYMVAPELMPEHLTWFKWESYMTWLSGVALLMVVYWAGAELYLIDIAKADLAVWQAILVSAGSLTIGWLVYDFLCKSGLGERPTLLMVLLFVLLMVMAYGYNQVFTGRATMLHLGAFTATIMTANVFFIIIPNQRIVVKDLQEGRTPDPKYGKIAKLRSTHNNYLTLPVIFLMLSNHYPLAFASPFNWLIAGLVFLMGVTIRHYFNTKHARKGNPTWTWAATAILFILIMWLSTRPLYQDVETAEALPLTSTEQVFASAAGFEDVQDIVLGRCSMCHAREPFYDGINRPPKGVLLETTKDITKAAKLIYIQAGVTTAMPPANVMFIEESERKQIVRWYRASIAKLPARLAGQ